MKASFDLTTVEGKKKAFNAKNGASVSLKNVPDGTVIDAVGVMTYEEEVDTYGNAQNSTVTVIFAADGQSYAGISDTVSKAADGLIDFVADTGIEEFQVKVTRQTSNQGREFLNLLLV